MHVRRVFFPLALVLALSVSLIVSAQPSNAYYVFSDTFDSSAFTQTSWSNSSGTWKVSGGRYVQNEVSPSHKHSFITATGFTNIAAGLFTTNLSFTALGPDVNCAAGIVFRSDTFAYELQLRPHDGAGKVNLYYTNGMTLKNSTAYALVAAKWYQVKLFINSTNTGYVCIGSTRLFNFTVPELGAGKFGVCAYDAQVLFEDVTFLVPTTTVTLTTTSTATVTSTKTNTSYSVVTVPTTTTVYSTATSTTTIPTTTSLTATVTSTSTKLTSTTSTVTYNTTMTSTKLTSTTSTVAYNTTVTTTTLTVGQVKTTTVTDTSYSFVTTVPATIVSGTSTSYVYSTTVTGTTTTTQTVTSWGTTSSYFWTVTVPGTTTSTSHYWTETYPGTTTSFLWTVIGVTTTSVSTWGTVTYTNWIQSTTWVTWTATLTSSVITTVTETAYTSTGAAWVTFTTPVTSVVHLTDRTTATSIIMKVASRPPSLDDFKEHPLELANWYTPGCLAAACVGALYLALPDLKTRFGVRGKPSRKPTPVPKPKKKNGKQPEVNRTYAAGALVAGGVVGYYAAQYLKTPVELTVATGAVLAVIGYVRYVRRAIEPARRKAAPPPPPEAPPPSETQPAPTEPASKDLERLKNFLRGGPKDG